MLFNAYNALTNLDTTNYIKIIMKTEVCDNFFDLESVRDNLIKNIDITSLDRITEKKAYENIDQITQDKKESNELIGNFYYWHKDHLKKNLSFHFKFLI